MGMNRAGSLETGFTIVETMIFLAISAALLGSALLLISGQQQKTQFNATVRDLDNEIQTVMGNVATGYYNNTGNTKCTAAGGTITELNNSGVNSEGTNAGCTFIGQVMVPSPDKSGFQIISAVGLRQDSSGSDVTSLAAAAPKLFTDTAQTYTLNGADFGWIKYTGGPPPPNNTSIAFMTSFVNSDSSGSTNTDAYAVNSTDTASGVERYLSGAPSVNAVKNPVSIQVCVSDGSQHGIITLSGGSTNTTISDGGCP